MSSEHYAIEVANGEVRELRGPFPDRETAIGEMQKMLFWKITPQDYITRHEAESGLVRLASGISFQIIRNSPGKRPQSVPEIFRDDPKPNDPNCMYHGTNEEHEFFENAARTKLVMRNHQDSFWTAHENRQFVGTAAQASYAVALIGGILDSRKVWRKAGTGFQLKDRVRQPD